MPPGCVFVCCVLRVCGLVCADARQSLVVPTLSPAGAFALDVPIPASAPYGATSLSLMWLEGPYGVGPVGGADLVVSDPRPPTVTLTLACADTFIRTGSAVRARLAVRATHVVVSCARARVAVAAYDLPAPFPYLHV